MLFLEKIKTRRYLKLNINSEKYEKMAGYKYYKYHKTLI